MESGWRGDAALVRHGAARAVASATFAPAAEHPLRGRLAEEGLEGDDELIVLRRTLGADGRSRAFVNDQPVSVARLAEIGAALVEVYGQHDRWGLHDPSTHGAALDRFGGLEDLARRVADAFHDWRQARARYRELAARREAAEREQHELRAAVDELARLAPAPGEDESLAARRTLLMQSARIGEALASARERLSAAGADAALADAQRTLAAVAEHDARLAEVADALDRAAIEAGEAVAMLEALDLDLDPDEQDRTEERLFALRAAGRRHGVAVDELAALHESLAARLATLEAGAAPLDAACAEARERETRFRALAGELGAARIAAARRLDRAIAAELAPLKLGDARFVTALELLAPAEWGAGGGERIRFTIATRAESEPGPLMRIASGGELSRFMLALKVVLAGSGSAGTLVFDEIDTGIGGAVADAVGARLQALAESCQVLVVTHQPQVAARAAFHVLVDKEGTGRSMRTVARVLDADQRHEEVARMLAGAEVTDEARAAAGRLITAPRIPAGS